MRAITASSKSDYRCLPGTPTVLHTRAPKWSAARIIRNLCPPVRPSVNILDRRLALLTGISTGLLTGRLNERFDRW